jgi:hypothetical protein
MLIFTTHAITPITVVTFDMTSVVKNKLTDTFANRKYYRLVLVEVVDFKGNAIDVTWINPASIKTYRYAVASPATT